MNLVEMMPELFGEEGKKVYYCQRCLNHGEYLVRKGHKLACRFKDCQCPACMMVERRRQLSNRLISMETAGSLSSVHSSSSGEDSAKVKERRPNCQRCAQHGVANRLKGHKRACPYRECVCAKCMVVVERQKLMADQIKLRRRQKREKSALGEKLRDNTSSPDGTVASNCETCTQQALSYQQLMAYLDPSGTSDSGLTLSAVLQACPHRKQED